MSKNIGLTLFHADWCSHCVNFLPTYKKMRNNKKASKIIDFVDYEESSFSGIREDKLKINGNDIKGFPTLKVNIFDDEYEFVGDRTEENIYNFILEKLKSKVN